MANMKKCDRCGVPYDLYNINRKNEKGTATLIQGIHWDYSDSFDRRSVMELCKPCAESFNEWLKNPTVINED